MSSSPSLLSCPRRRASSNRCGGNQGRALPFVQSGDYWIVRFRGRCLQPDVVESACVAYFPVDSRNENLPEKCIHPNCASRPGGSCCRLFVARPRAPATWLSRLEGMTWDFPSRSAPCSGSHAGQTRCNRWLQGTTVGCIPIV